MLNSIAILGRPNVGKSSLFNKLTKTRNAIVSDHFGLTKDRNFGYLLIKNQRYLIIDTGGIGSEITQFSDAITEQAIIAAEDSNLILLVIDSSEELTNDDINLLEVIRKMNKKFFVVLNKIDIKQRSNAKDDLMQKGVSDIIEISAEHSKGIKDLQLQITKQFDQLEEDDDMQGTKIAVIGRPNAGKSTFINQFIKQNRLIVSNIPGTTIDSIHVPFLYDGKDYVFIDTAGIRKKYKQSHAVEYFSYVRAMHSVGESDIVLMLIDATDGVVDQDLRILNLVRGYGKPVIVALNKIDEISKKNFFQLTETKKFQNSALNNIHVMKISALHKHGFKKLFNTILRVNKLAKTNFSTGRLNKLLKKITSSINLPSISGRKIKMRYVHFGGIHPTKLIIHSNVSSKIPSNFKQYLINSFRDELNLKSIDLKISFKKGKNPFDSKKNTLTSRQIKKKKRLVKYTRKSK
tara:strand:+ start:18 stop:1403 length:1386 start_codon:yes stop_codon:yes gene_type:complete